LEDENNIGELKEGLRLNEVIMNNTGYQHKIMPLEFTSVDSSYIKKNCYPSSNPVGTCKASTTMEDGVVNSKGNYNIIKLLR
jgi:hypothetical protein